MVIASKLKTDDLKQNKSYIREVKSIDTIW